MIVTMLPAKAVAAASSDGPQMYETLRLYLDSGNGLTENSNLTGAFSNERYASVWGWRENGYDSVEFTSTDPSIATVNSKGKVTAVKVRETLHCDGSSAQWNFLNGKTYTYDIDINKMFYNN